MEWHECLASVKNIPVVFFYTVKKKRRGRRREIAIAKGYEGVLYRLVKSRKQRNTATIESNNGRKHATKTTVSNIR